ncbi:hypothetical protein FA13DRAFT_1188917 [Coprinellus micaceus]|uniref:Uncharacterized protein n=1 Tax=Coprinellus micaceus TaxID=71717 RepID=A0A4Y7STH5_COPMI|nr:hypothetical protein FA13DRAFT_1188917 [Coprinellus micaceus]
MKSSSGFLVFEGTRLIARDPTEGKHYISKSRRRPTGHFQPGQPLAQSGKPRVFQNPHVRSESDALVPKNRVECAADTCPSWLNSQCIHEYPNFGFRLHPAWPIAGHFSFHPGMRPEVPISQSAIPQWCANPGAIFEWPGNWGRQHSALLRCALDGNVCPRGCRDQNFGPEAEILQPLVFVGEGSAMRCGC